MAAQKIQQFYGFKAFWVILGRFHGNKIMIDQETLSDCRSYSGIRWNKISLQKKN